MKLTISLLQLILYLAGNVAQNGAKFVGNIKDDDEGGTITILDIQDDNKTQYLNQNFEQGNYNYGYDIKPEGPVGQFHHENKSPDDIVYGCYGYAGPDNKNHMTFYVSDAWGYRPVRQEQDLELFFPADNPPGTGHMNGRMTPWADLIFPDMCAHFAERIASSTNVVTKTPVASLPSSIGSKLQSTALPGSPVPFSSQPTKLTSAPVPASSFDVIQFNTPTGTPATPFSRLTSISNTDRVSRLPTNAPGKGNLGSQVPSLNQNENTPGSSTPSRNVPNRFSTATTSNIPGSSPQSGSSLTNGPTPSSSTFASRPNPSIGNNNRAPTPPSSSSLNTDLSNNGPLSPNSGPSPGTVSGPLSFSRPITSPIPSTSTTGSLSNINQSTRTRQSTPSASLNTNPRPSSNSNKNNNNIGPLSEIPETSTNSFLPAFQQRSPSTARGSNITPSTFTVSNRFSTSSNRLPTPVTGGSSSFGPTSRPINQGTSNIPLTGLGQTAGPNRQQTPSSSLGTGQPINQETSNPITGTGQTTGINRQPTTSFPSTGQSNFRATARPNNQGSPFTGTGPTFGSTLQSTPTLSTVGSKVRGTSRPATQDNRNTFTGPGQTTENNEFQTVNNLRPSTQPAIPNRNNQFTGTGTAQTFGSTQQTPSSTRANNNSRGTTRPTTSSFGNNPSTGTSQTSQSNIPEASTPTRGSGTRAPSSSISPFTQTETQTNSNNPRTQSSEAARISTLRPVRPHNSANPYNNAEDEDVSVNTVDNRNVNPTASTLRNPGTSRFSTLIPNNGESITRGSSPSRGSSLTSTSSNFPSTPGSTSPGRGNVATSTRSPPGLSSSQGSTTFLLPSSNPSSTAPGAGDNEPEKPSSPSSPGNNRPNSPTSNTPFPRPGSSFFNNPSTLHPSSTNQNTIPSGANGSSRRPSTIGGSNSAFGSGSTTSFSPTRRPTTDNFGNTDRFSQTPGAPIIPQEPEEGPSSNQPISPSSNSVIGTTPTRFGASQGTTPAGSQTPSVGRQPTIQPAFGSRRPTGTTHSSSNLPNRQSSFTSLPQNSTSSSGSREPQDSFCETQCSSCKTATDSGRIRDEDFSSIPGAILSNIPVIFYPDCSANAYTRPAIVPFCPSQKTQCGDQNQPLTMKFPDTSNFIVGHNAPLARNAFASEEAAKVSRRTRRGRQPRSLKQ